MYETRFRLIHHEYLMQRDLSSTVNFAEILCRKYEGILYCNFHNNMMLVHYAAILTAGRTRKFIHKEKIR